MEYPLWLSIGWDIIDTLVQIAIAVGVILIARNLKR